jgi:hypothetical protein
MIYSIDEPALTIQYSIQNPHKLGDNQPRTIFMTRRAHTALGGSRVSRAHRVNESFVPFIHYPTRNESFIFLQ